MSASLIPQPTAEVAAPGATAGKGVPGYRPDPALFDEMVDATGALRPHWRPFGSFLASCPAADLAGRLPAVQRLLRDHGVTYNVFDDAMGTSRPWALDLLPFIIGADEWTAVSRGLFQRARLLNALLADFYGPQRTLDEGWLPPALVHANPGFLRPAVGVSPAGGAFAFVFAFDLVRDSSGRWMVLADRVQAPSGGGYALENRMVLSNVFAEEFNASPVHRLTGYFDTKREILRGLGPRRAGDGGILVLTPGPYNETYFEHAFKARQLGFPLVEGADLTVRDRRVHLKTLEGLRRSDVLLRHVDDVFCDPLELQAESLLGVPGLLEAWRSGSVALANGLGTGVVESPALHPFLPGLCRLLLGEELIQPCVPTWWCGQRRELDLVLAEPERWVIKPAFVRGARDPVFMADLSAAERGRMVAAIRTSPHQWVAQESLQLSTAPTLVAGKIEPRSLVWRAFVVVGGGRSTVMPGGLARVSPEPRRWIVTMRSGGISKDTWVVGGAAESDRPSASEFPLEIRSHRPPSEVPSRVADHLFWLGRYAERLEQLIRVLRATLQRFAGERAEMQASLDACHAFLLPLGIEQTPGFSPERIESLFRDPRCEGSIPELLGRLRYNASAARDRLSDDTWRLFNRLDREARLAAGPFVVTSALDLLDSLVLNLAAFSGMQLENMTRGHGWRFLEIGRRIERAYVVSCWVKKAATLAVSDESVLMPLLEICDSTMTYRRLHFSRPRLAPVADLLLLNQANPRAVAYQLTALDRQTAQLPEMRTVDTGRMERRQAEMLLSELASLRLPNRGSASAAEPRIVALCEHLATGLETLSDVLTEHYFSHALRK